MTRAWLGVVVAAVLVFGLVVAAHQAVQDAPRRAVPVVAPPATGWTPRPTPTLVPPTRPDGEPAWCVDHCSLRARTAAPARPTP